MFEVTKPIVEIASRDHIMFFLGLRPMAFGPKFISNYFMIKKRDDTHHGTHARRDTGNVPEALSPQNANILLVGVHFFKGRFCVE